MSRRLLPRLADQASPPSHDQAKTTKRRRTVVAAACNSCRLRRTKCDNDRPCRPCVLRNVVCEFDVPVGLTKATHQREQLELLRSDNATMLELLWFMQNQPLEESHAFLQRIRSHHLLDMSQMRTWLRASNGPVSFLPAGEAFTAESSVAFGDVDDQDQTESSLASGQETDIVASASSSRDARGMLGTLHASAVDKVNASLPIKSVLEGLEAYGKLCGNLMSIYTADKTGAAYSQLINMARDTESTDFSSLAQSSLSLESRFHVAEIAGMACIGLRYILFSRPKQPRILSAFNELQEYVKAVLRQMIEIVSMKGVNLCGLLAVYCMVAAAPVATTYCELGIRLGHAHGLNSLTTPDSANVQDFKESRGIWRTLLLCSSWLGASLDSIELSGPASLSNTRKQTEYDEYTKETLQQVTLDIRNIKAKSFVINSTDNITDLVLLHDLRLELKSLYENLPVWMRLSRLTSQRGSRGLRQSIYYVHQYYLSALELLFRHTMHNPSLFDPGHRRNDGDLQVEAISEGLMAAKMAAKVLQLMHEEGLLVQICWLCIFTSYTTSIVLLYATVQKILAGHVASDWNGELELAQSCLLNLEYCAVQDHFAAALHDVLSAIVTVLGAEMDGLLQVHSNKLDGERDSIAFLLVTHAGPSNLEKLSRDLLRLIREPLVLTAFESLLPHSSATTTTTGGEHFSSGPLGPLERWMEATIVTPMVCCIELQSVGLYHDSTHSPDMSQLKAHDFSLLLPKD